MKTIKPFSGTALFIRAFLLTIILITGGGNFAWAQQTLPYSYDLEENDLSTEGWDSHDLYDGGSSYNKSQRNNSSTYAHSSSYSFRFYGSSGLTQYLISPQIETSTTGIVVSFYCHAPATAAAQTRTFSVGYSTTDATYTSFGNYTDYSITFDKSASAEWKLITTKISANNAKYIAIKYTSSSTSYFDDFAFEKQTPYITPTDFALTTFDATSATFSWTAGNKETTWQFDYHTNSGFTPGDGFNRTDVSITDNPYTLTGLTTGTTYYAAIRADYGDGHYSDWTEKVSFTPRTEIVTTINDGSNTNTYIPFNGNAANSASNATQFILPASQLEAIQNRQITQLVFHSSSESKSWGVAEWEIYMKEISTTSFSSNSFVAYGTKVCNAKTMSISSNELTITLNTPFNYNDGNLMIGIKTTKAGTYGYCSFYGVSASSGTNNGLSGTNATPTYYSFYPKITITSVPITTEPVQMDQNGYTTFASPRPLNLTTANLPSGLKAYKASVLGSTVKFTEVNDCVQANTGVLLEGTTNTTYNIPVALSGSNISSTNEFEVNSSGGVFDVESGYTYFAMKKDSSPLTFGTFTPSSVAIPKNKAYLKVLTESLSASRSLQFIFDDNEETEVKNIDVQKTSGKGKYYNLHGQRVVQPAKGLYILNGKKFIAK